MSDKKHIEHTNVSLRSIATINAYASCFISYLTEKLQVPAASRLLGVSEFASKCDLSGNPIRFLFDAVFVIRFFQNYNGTMVGDGCNVPHYVPDVFLMSIILFMGTFLLSVELKDFKNALFFPSKVETYALIKGKSMKSALSS